MKLYRNTIIAVLLIVGLIIFGVVMFLQDTSGTQESGGLKIIGFDATVDGNRVFYNVTITNTVDQEVTRTLQFKMTTGSLSSTVYDDVTLLPNETRTFMFSWSGSKFVRIDGHYSCSFKKPFFF